MGMNVRGGDFLVAVVIASNQRECDNLSPSFFRPFSCLLNHLHLFVCQPVKVVDELIDQPPSPTIDIARA